MSEEKKNPPRETPSNKFCAVIQADFPDQMDVLRWLKSDPYYIVIVAEHSADTYADDDFSDDENGVKVRKNGDGTESEFRVGDAKPLHYHVMVQTASKIRAGCKQNPCRLSVKKVLQSGTLSGSQ